MGNVHSRERLCVAAGNVWKLFSADFCREPKTTLKKKSAIFFLKKRYISSDKYMTHKLTPNSENSFIFSPPASCVHNIEKEKAVIVNGTIACTVLCENPSVGTRYFLYSFIPCLSV